MTTPTTTAAALHVRAVRYSDRPQAWEAAAEALGAGPCIAAAGEQAYRLGSGCLVLRPAHGKGPRTAIELGSGTAPTHHPAASAATTSRVITGPDGAAIATVVAAAAPDPHGAVSACPLWMTSDVAGAGTALRAAGLLPRLASESGTWADLSAPGGGLVAVHEHDTADRDDPAHAVLCFEVTDALALADRFAAAGLRGDIVDESYGRSLRFDDPDAGGSGAEIWVNETITDLYGYRRSERAAR